MEEDQEFKYVCKLCSKSFPCGRSLGGHMKSHLIHNNSKDDRKFINSRVKVSSLMSNYTDSGLETGSQAGYGLRENPKKTWRIAGSSEETSVYDSKLCRECGKGFQSLKALIAHMKCHSNSTTNSSENEQDSWTSSKVVDSQSENETTNTIRRRTSTSRRRRRTRYMGNTTTSSSNFSVVNINASSSVTEIEQEQQEEVAWCLMMLSRDVGPWGGLKFGADFDHSSTSDDDSGFSGDPSSLKMNQVSRIKGATLESLKLRKLKNKMLEEEVSVGGFSKIDRTKKTLILEKIELAEAQLGSNKFNSSNKRKLRDAYDHTSKRGKYECGTCNKVFRSYQALGGHRASHKKIKGCFASKIESSDNTTEFDTDLSTDHHPIASDHSKFSNLIHHQDVVVKAERISTKSKGHSCPICLKVFPTGQALGGHKRSHLIGVSAESSRNHQSTIVIPKPATAEVRDFLDLNLPAPAEEESSTNQAAAAQVFKPWWAGSNHKSYEALVS